MSKIRSVISKIRLYSALLFIVPSFALFFSLFLNNHIISYQHYIFPHGIKEDVVIVSCNAENKYCHQIFQQNQKFNACSKYKKRIVKRDYILNGNFIKFSDAEKLIAAGKPLKYKVLTEYEMLPKTDKPIIDPRCIKNSVLYPLYKNFSALGELHEKIQSKARLATSVAVFPFIDGSVSISNIVKRWPVSLIFKPLLFLTSLLMFFYWTKYQQIFPIVSGLNIVKRKELFFIFGLLSSFFLFLHILFLGMDIDNEIFKKMRRLIIILFILFELIAQCLLAKKIFLFRNSLSMYAKKTIIYLKIIFVIGVVLVAITALAIMILTDPGDKFNYVLEWNYFFFLLVFYLLSSVMWKHT